MAKHRKTIIAEDIQKYLKREKLIKRNWSVVIPEGGYTAQEHGHFFDWDGNFEVFSSLQDIDSYGTFQAMVPKGIGENGDYDLVITYKRKEHWVFG